MVESVTPDIQSLAQLLEETLTHDPREPQRILEYIRECYHIGIDVLPFDINRSESACRIEEEQAIRVGFSLILPENASCIKAILRERGEHGAFTSFQDFCERLDIEKLPDAFLVQAIQIGSFDSIEASRSALFQGRHTIIQQVQSAKEEKATGQFSLYAQPAAGPSGPIPLPVVEEWTKEQRISQEEQALGFSFEECLLDIEADDADADAQPDDESNDLPPASEADAAEAEAEVEAVVSTIDVPTSDAGGETSAEVSVTNDAAIVPEEPVESLASTHELSEPEPEEAPLPAQPQSAIPDSEDEAQPENIPEPAVPAEPVMPQAAVPIVREQPATSEGGMYPPASAQVEPPIPNFEEPPLPPCEFTADEYEFSFPDGMPVHIPESVDFDQGEEPPIPIREIEDEWKTPDTSAPAEDELIPQPPYLTIQISTLITTEQTLTRLKTILLQYPGTIPVHFACVNLENQPTIVSAPANYSTDASEPCLAAIAAITGYHAITVAE